MVGGIPTPLKNTKVKWDDYSQYMEKKNMFQTTNHVYTIIQIYSGILEWNNPPLQRFAQGNLFLWLLPTVLPSNNSTVVLLVIYNYPLVI